MRTSLFARLAAFGSLVGVASMAHAVDSPITTVLAAVDMSGVAVAVGAAALVIVAIALTFKGPDIAKRIIRKF